MHYLTPAEQERLAYAEGYTETAAVLARLDDAHRALGNEALMQTMLDDATDALDVVKDERDELRDERDALFEDYKRMRAERDDARVAARAALEYLTDVVEGAGSPFYNQAGAADRLRELLLEVLP